MDTSGFEFSFNVTALLLLLVAVAVGFVIMSLITDARLKKRPPYSMKKTWDLALCVFIFLGIIQCILPDSFWKWLSLAITGALGIISMLDWMRRKRKRQKEHEKRAKRT